MFKTWFLSSFFSLKKKSNSLFHLGICNQTSPITFICRCHLGWTGRYCQQIINNCENIQCLNKGKCISLFLNFTCDCRGTGYSGRFCEIESTRLIVHQIVSKSVSYVAILVLIAVALFIIILDILKYCFGIDVTKDELEQIRRKKQNHLRRIHWL